MKMRLEAERRQEQIYQKVAFGDISDRRAHSDYRFYDGGKYLATSTSIFSIVL